MRAHRLEGRTAGAHDIEGRVLVHDLGPDLRKGTVLTAGNLDRVRQAGEVHVVELEPGDLHEDIAARRLAAALSGPNLQARPPVQSQARLIATRRGLVRVRAELVDAINALGYMSVFTLMDGQAVAEGEEVVGCKVTPVAVPGRLIEEAGMKGHRAGGAEVSGKHANFFLARPGASAEDVHRLLVEVQAAVLERSGLLLRPEVRLIGSFEPPDLLRAGGDGGAP